MPFPQQMLMSGFCGDVLQRKLLIPGDATPCKYIKTFDSKPSSWITELTFFYLLFQLVLLVFTDGLRMTILFCSNFYSFVPRQNENKFLQMFLQSQCCIRTSLLISTTLPGWERGRQLRFESLLCSSQDTIF